MNPGTPAKSAIGAVLTASVIVYGSLYPFQFAKSPDAATGFRYLLGTWSHLDGLGEVVANLLLYIPLGYYLGMALPKCRAGRRVALVTAACGLMSLALELAQFWDLKRDADLGDFWSNTAGALLGAMAATLQTSAKRNTVLGRAAQRPFVVILLAAFLGYHIYTGDARGQSASAARVAVTILEETVLWNAAFVLLEGVAGKGRRAAAGLVIALALCANSLVEHRFPALPLWTGALLGFVLWSLVPACARWRGAAIAGAFAMVVVFGAVYPFHIGRGVSQFDWVPFRTLMMSTREFAIPSFLGLAFTCGALIWLPMRAGIRLRHAAPGAGLIVLCLEVAQHYLPDRMPGVTEIVVLVLMAVNLKLMDEDRKVERDREALSAAPSAGAGRG
jgi:VanZ family protein